MKQVADSDSQKDSDVDCMFLASVITATGIAE
uniref:Pheromone n=1 Tax=Peronospora matthiolae TaxID=2874970 RepID=A0AAV1T335_9STRA